MHLDAQLLLDDLQQVATGAVSHPSPGAGRATEGEIDPRPCSSLPYSTDGPQWRSP
jgi:hypothetical protein